MNLVLSSQTVSWLLGAPGNRSIFLPNGLLPVNWFILTGLCIPAIYEGKKSDWITTRNRDYKEFAHFWKKYLSYCADLSSLTIAQVYPSSELAILEAWGCLHKPKLASIKSRILSCRATSFWVRQIFWMNEGKFTTESISVLKGSGFLSYILFKNMEKERQLPYWRK